RSPRCSCSPTARARPPASSTSTTCFAPASSDEAVTIQPPPRRRRPLWRPLRRATRGPRDAALAWAIQTYAGLFRAAPLRLGLAIGEQLGAGAHRLLARPRRLAVTHVGVAFPELDLRARERLVAETFRSTGRSFAELALFG